MFLKSFFLKNQCLVGSIGNQNVFVNRSENPVTVIKEVYFKMILHNMAYMQQIISFIQGKKYAILLLYPNEYQK